VTQTEAMRLPPAARAALRAALGLALALPLAGQDAPATEPPTLRYAVAPIDAHAIQGAPADVVLFADPDAALDAVAARRRAERAGEVPPARLEVLLGPGIHERTRPLRLGAAHSGGPGTPTVLRGVPGRTTLCGARRVPVEQLRVAIPDELRARLPAAARDRVRALDLGAVGIPRPGALAARGMGRATVPGPTELFWNRRPLPLARWPDQGYAKVGAVVDPGSVPRDAEPDVGAAADAAPRGGVFELDEPRVERWQAAVGEAWVQGYWHWDWADELLPIAAVDAATRQVRLGLPHHYGLDAKARFAIVNAVEELDRPGECALLAGRNLMLCWPPEDAPELILASVLGEPLLAIEGAESILVQDLELGFTRDAAVRVDGGAFVRIEDCAIRGTGAHGIVLRGIGHAVRRCRFEDCGAAALTLDGGDRATLTPGGHAVEDSVFTRFARLERTYRPAVAIAGVGHRVVHNRIHDGPHAAILVAGNEHRIEANEIFAVLQETGDCGAIYMGRDWAMHGVLIRHNLIRDLPGSSDRWQNAIYLDDMASGITVEGNVLWRCNLGMLIGGGRSLTIRHNVLVDCGGGIRFDARGVGWMAKQIAEPGRSTLHQRLAALPIDSPPWSERYPEVRATLAVGFGRPIGSAVLGNAFFRTPFGEVADPRSVRVDGNRSFDREIDPTAAPSFDVREVPGFPAIPVGEIGPRPRE
jgi:hypothetical protein